MGEIMKLKQIIELYRSKPKSEYPAENWVRLGQYLEPYLDEIEYVLSNKKKPITDETLIKEAIKDLIKDVIKSCDKSMYEPTPEKSTYAVGKRDMYKCVIAVMEKYI